MSNVYMLNPGRCHVLVKSVPPETRTTASQRQGGPFCKPQASLSSAIQGSPHKESAQKLCPLGPLF